MPGPLGDTRGVTALFAAVFLVVFVGLTAMVVDLGQIIIVKSELQNGADSGALAGVVDLLYYGSDEAVEAAKTYTTRASTYRLTKPPPGPDGVEVAELGPETLQVRVRKAVGTSAGAVPTVFARIWGIESSRVEALAVATMDHRIIGTGPGNLMPFGVHKRLADADDDGLYDVGNTVDIYPHTWSPGNFGLLDLNGGANSNSETVSWIEHGYDGVFILPESTGGYLQMEGDPGISGGSLEAPTRSRLGDRVLFPVFDEVTGVGANTIFRVIDMVGAIITEIKFDGAAEERYFRIKIVNFAATNLIVGEEGTPSNSSLSKPILIR